MKNHSQFADFLDQELMALRDRAIAFTAGGVVEEGGPLIKDIAAQSKDGPFPAPPATVTQKPATVSAVLPGKDTGFKWGPKSQAELVGVKTALVECATLALERFSRIDFTCYDGIRTEAEQRQHIKNGTSKTMKSKHLDGLAVDLVPIIGGIPKWDWNGCYEIAFAMDQAATHMGIASHITWGGAWDRRLSQFGGDASLYAKEVENYRSRHGGSDFIDGPHFEWVD